MKGKIKWFNKEKGFGFIVDDKGNDLFVHHSELPVGFPEPEMEQEVEFKKVKTEKGLQARNIKILG